MCEPTQLDVGVHYLLTEKVALWGVAVGISALSECIWETLYSSIYIAPLNSHRQTEALLVRLAPRKETSFKK